MKSPAQTFAIIFFTIWIILMTYTIGRKIYYKKYTQPYLIKHAATTALLYHHTCILSGMDTQKLEKNVLEVGMTPLTELTVPRYSFDLKQIFKRWEIKADKLFKEKWKYKPHPYEVRLDETEIRKGSDYYGIPKLRCAMRMHTGIVKVKRRPHYIPRKSFHAKYTNYVRNMLLSTLKKSGAEIIDAPVQWRYSQRNYKPIAFTREGQQYHLKVSPFFIEMEYARDTDCLTCDLYPQPEVVRDELNPH